MTISKKDQDASSNGPIAFAWETLPELAKSRWEEAVAYDVTMENQLARAKSERALAEIQRQRIAREILEATKEVCEEILTDGKLALDSARRMEADAAKKLGDSQWELEEAQRERNEAETYRDKVIAEADQRVADIVDRARANAERECLDLKQRASLEAKRILDQAELMRAAIQEELETQKIYTETAQMKAESHSVLAMVRQQRDELSSPDDSSPQQPFHGLAEAEESVNDVAYESLIPEEVGSAQDEQPAGPEESTLEGSTNGKKRARRAGVRK